MPRRTRGQIIGKLDERDRRERDKELKALRRELRHLWRQRQQDQAEGVPTDSMPDEPSESPDA